MHSSYPNSRSLKLASLSLPPSTTADDGTWSLPPGLSGHSGATAPEVVDSPDNVPTDPAPPPSSPPPLPRFPRPPRPARPPDLPPASRDRWKEILDHHDSIGDLDYFALLGVPYNAGLGDVQRAFAEQMKLWHPDSLPDELWLLKPYAMRILVRLNAAREELSMPSSRQAYLRKLGRAEASPALRPPAMRYSPPPTATAKPEPTGVAAIAERERQLQAIEPVDEPRGAAARLLQAIRERFGQ